MGTGVAFDGLAELKAIAARSRDTFAEEALFAARLRRAEYVEALALIDSMASKQPARAKHWHELRGGVSLRQREFRQARAAFEAAQKEDPAAYSAIGPQIDLDVLEGRPEAGIARVNTFLKAQPQSHSALLTLALLSSKHANATPQEVRAMFEAAIRAAPSEPVARVRLVEYLIRRSLFKDALAAGQEALAALPDDPLLLDAVGRAQGLAGDVEQAAKTFRKLASQLQSSPTPHLRLAELYLAAGRVEPAESAYRTALDLEPLNMAAQQGLVEVLLRSRRAADAQALVQRFRTSRPNRPAGYALEASFLDQRGDRDAALQVLRDGVRKTGSRDLAQRLVGGLLLSGNRAAAEQVVDAWLKRTPSDPEARYLKAGILLLRNERAAGEAELRAAIESAPGHVPSLNNLASILADRADPGAVQYARRALEQKPDSPVILDTLASALAATGNLAEAQRVHARSLELSPNDVNLRLTKAKLALLAGDKAAARAEIESLDKLGTQYARRAELLKLRERL